MTQTIALVVSLVVALFGASNANPFEMYDDASLGGPTEAAMQAALLKFKNACVEISGSDAGYEKAIEALSPTIQCVMERFETVQFTMDLPDTAESRKTIVDQYCPAFNESVECFDDILDGFAMCSNGSASALKTLYKKMIQNLVDVNCQNNGQVFLGLYFCLFNTLKIDSKVLLLQEVRKPEFRACLQHVRTNVQQCKVAGFIWDRPISQIGEEGCSEMRSLKQCVHEKVSTCNNTAYEDIFNAIYDPVLEAANCKLNSQSEVNVNEV